jgi:hypothetical protein
MACVLKTCEAAAFWASTNSLRDTPTAQRTVRSGAHGERRAPQTRTHTARMPTVRQAFNEQADPIDQPQGTHPGHPPRVQPAPAAAKERGSQTTQAD